MARYMLREKLYTDILIVFIEYDKLFRKPLLTSKLKSILSSKGVDISKSNFANKLKHLRVKGFITRMTYSTHCINYKGLLQEFYSYVREGLSNDSTKLTLSCFDNFVKLHQNEETFKVDFYELLKHGYTIHDSLSSLSLAFIHGLLLFNVNKHQLSSKQFQSFIKVGLE